MSQADRDRLADILARTDALETELVGKLDDAFLDRAVPAAQVADELAGKLNGAVGVKLDQVSALGAKLGMKASRKAAEKLYSAYTYGQNVMPGFPTADQVAYGNATGDYIGSMGFIPTGEIAHPNAIGESSGPLATDGSQETTDASPAAGSPTPPTYTPPPGPSFLPPKIPAPIPTGPTDRYFPPVNDGRFGCARVTQGWVTSFDPSWYPGWVPGAFSAVASGSHPPFTDDQSAPVGFPIKCQCVDGCHWGSELGQVQVRLCCALGEELAINADTGLIQAVPVQYGTDPSQNWVQPVLVACDPDKLRELPPDSGPVGGGTITGGTGAGQCCPPPKVEFSCPKELPLDCGPNPALPQPVGPQLDPDICTAFNGLLDAPGDVAKDFWPALVMSFGMVGTNDITQSIISALSGSTLPIVPGLLNRLFKWLKEMAETSGKMLSCDRPEIVPFLLTRAALGFVQQWGGVVPQQVLALLDHTINLGCQSQVPTGPAADDAYLADEITKEQWECWQKLNGNYTNEAEKVMHGKRARPSAADLALLQRRKFIPDGSYTKKARRVGVLDDEDAQAIYDLTQAWPGLQDTIRMMVRDAADEDAVTLAGLDEDFDKKWVGKLKDFGTGNGITDDLAKLYWRAHWQLPSPTQLFEMLHRLRPDRVDPKLAVTPELVKQVLKQDDHAPAFVDRLMAISYRPITRTDAAHMYQLRTIGNDELKGYYQDEGLNETDAGRLTEWAEKNRRVQEIRRSGLPPPRALVTRYAKGLLSRDEFERIVGLITVSDEQAQAMKAAGELEKQVLHRTRILGATKKALLRGVLDESDAHAQLVQNDIEAGEAAELVADWLEERDAAGKLATTAKLCQWRSMGILTSTEHAKALERLNWSPFQAERIMAECEIQEFNRQKKLAEIAAAKAKAAADKKEAQRKACLPKAKKCAEEGFPTS